MENIHAVFNRLKTMAELEEDEEREALALSAVALAELKRRLKQPSHISCEPVIGAAAGLALYDLLLKRFMKDPDTDFKAGDMSVSRRPEALLNLAAQKRDRLLALATEYLEDEAFVFRSV